MPNPHGMEFIDMDEKVTYWASVVFGALALLLLVLNISLVNSNRHLHEEIGGRQDAINRGANLGQGNQALVQALADIAIKGNDTRVRDLLAAQGITIKPNSPADAKAAASAPAPDASKSIDDKKKK